MMRACMLLIPFLCAQLALADAMTLRGSSIPISKLTIMEIQSGRVYYGDNRGRRQWRELEEVQTIQFDDLPILDEAEALLAAGEAQEGLLRLLRASIETNDELQRLWIHVRLNRVHQARNEFVEAASHAAVVIALREDAYWRRLEPLMDVNRPSFAAVEEARLNLRHAREQVSDGRLQSSIDRMLRAIQLVHDALRESQDGPTISRGQTLSGLTIDQIRAGHVEHRTPERDDENVRNDDPSPALEPREVPTRSTSTGDSPEAIESLLQQRRTSDALAICRRLETSPGTRSLSEFLHQYGRALAAEAQPRDAAVMFMRCALVYPSSSVAGPSLIETALLYRDVFQKPTTARRLLEQAIEIAGGQRETAVVERARTLLDSLPRNES